MGCGIHGMTRTIVGTGLAVITCALVIVWVIGLFNTLGRRATACGLILWQMCNATYIGVPALMLIYVCCGLPFLHRVHAYRQHRLASAARGSPLVTSRPEAGG